MKATGYTKSTISLNHIYEELEEVLLQLKTDLNKAFSGNKAAAQRVRTGSIHFEQVAKMYRKLSIQENKAQEEQKRKKKKTCKK